MSLPILMPHDLTTTVSPRCETQGRGRACGVRAWDEEPGCLPHTEGAGVTVGRLGDRLSASHTWAAHSRGNLRQDPF